MTWQIHIIRLDSAEERCSCFCVLFLGSRIGVFMSLMLRLLMIIDLIILQQFKLCSSNVFFYYIYNFFSVWITYVFCMIILKQFMFFYLCSWFGFIYVSFIFIWSFSLQSTYMRNYDHSIRLKCWLCWSVLIVGI
jgi:hypothetical protein